MEPATRDDLLALDRGGGSAARPLRRQSLRHDPHRSGHAQAAARLRRSCRRRRRRDRARPEAVSRPRRSRSALRPTCRCHEATRPARPGAVQSARQCVQVWRRGAGRGLCARRRRAGGDLRDRPGQGHSREATSSASSRSSTGAPRATAARPAPASASRSPAASSRRWAARSGPRARPSASAAPASPSGCLPMLRGCEVSEGRILVVDDEPQIQRFLRPALTAAGYEPLQALTAAEAERLVGDGGAGPDDPRPRPARQGRQGRDPRPPRLVASCRSSCCPPATRRPRRSRRLDLGADDYVEKPFGIGELIARIRTALRHRRAEPGVPAHHRGRWSGRRHAQATGLTGRRALRLTPKEYDLLVHLARHAGLVADTPPAALRGLGTGPRRGRALSAGVHRPAARQDRARSQPARNSSAPSPGSAIASANKRVCREARLRLAFGRAA